MNNMPQLIKGSNNQRSNCSTYTTGKALLSYLDEKECDLKELINDLSKIFNNLVQAIEDATLE